MFILNHIGDDWNFNFSNYFWSISWNVPRKFNTHWTNSIHKLRKSFFPGHRTVEKNAEKIRNIVKLAENIWDENFEKKKLRDLEMTIAISIRKTNSEMLNQNIFHFFRSSKIHFVCIQIQFKCQFKIGNCS